MSALQNLFASFRNTAVTEREKGTYFEELIICYLKNEATYRDLYSDVWTFAEWAEQYGHGWNKKDTGIDLVARTTEGEYHAIQCKFYADDYKVQKSDIDSFFTASGKQPFSRRLIVTTTNNWGPNAEDALIGQQPPVTKLDLQALEDSQIDWSQYASKQAIVLKPKKQLRDHQIRAVARVEAGLATAERGKLIMACGTGKTFTSLKIAEKLVGAGKRVLFLVPSLSLLSQTLTEWTQESDTPLHSFAVCSDSDVGKKRKKDDDVVQTLAHELRYPATTDAARLATEMAKRHDNEHMSVVFSTYHSIDVISRAQLEHGLADFDLIICDEAHRTTGATFDGKEESAFVRVHDGAYIRAAKRLYMTATPRIYGDSAKVTAEKGDVTLCSMDDDTLFGKELFVITFSEAVKAGLLVDYKVLVLAMDEAHISRSLQNLLKDNDNQIKVEDAAKIVGCWKALSKQDTREDLGDDAAAMRRAVAFCQVIEYQNNAKTHKISSKKIADMFSAVVEEYKASNPDEDCATLMCEADHIDGGMNAGEKESKLAWLKSPVPDDTCRVLSNVRCLSEGVDVPALDAVLFLTPRSSQVDVVQSVGRVMRLAEGKKRGYVILPVVIPAGMAPDEALNDNKTYKVVWQVLQALRSHDDRFDAMINKLDLVGNDTSKMEVIAVTEKVQKKADKNAAAANLSKGKGTYGIGSAAKAEDSENNPIQQTLEFEIGEIERAIFAKVVQKCGNRHHWEDWANDIAKIARTHITRITEIVNHEDNLDEVVAFEGLVAELKDDLNDSITREEVIEMLAQHLITKPVFDALFADYSFASHNPMSKAMQNVLDKLHEHRLDKEADTLEKFYASVKLRAEGIDKAEGKQKIIVELYDKFFANAFPRLRDKLGIVYTPVEVVDFIIHSVEHILQAEFGQSLASDGVHIIDPFTGTGTFITRLLQSGIIPPAQLKKKFKGEIHANELVLLAYYIAAINIEAVYHGIAGGDYVPFDGICLTDTFQMYEKEDLVDQVLFQNSARRKRQKALDIRVIIGNPPYSVGQDRANDNNQNVAYPQLDERIRTTYAAQSVAGNVRNLYDSYIRAIRWASDRLGDSGVIGFVTNAGFLEANTADGLRQCLVEEFSDIYVFHLRGNARTSGELRRKEKDNVFGMGSRAPIAISLLVKKPQATTHGRIFWHDIGDYLSREEKLEKVSVFGCIGGIAAANLWREIMPDAHGDWVKQRDDSLSGYIVMGSKSKQSEGIFEVFTLGTTTNRDAWCYNASKVAVEDNIQHLLAFYNSERERFNSTFFQLHDTKLRSEQVSNFIDTDPTKISWTRALKADLAKDRSLSYMSSSLVSSLYRPFSKQWVYFNRNLNEYVYQLPRIFPDSECKNRVIQINAKYNGVGFISLISDHLPDLHCNGDSQCFPLYLYEEADAHPAKQPQQDSLFDSQSAVAANVGRTRRDAITDEGLAHFVAAYPGEMISKEDIFYYVYGLLHSQDYRERFADNLSKELPRIPCVKGATNFWHFSQAGRALAELHLHYEKVPMYEGAKVDAGGKTLTSANYRVEKMKYGKKGKDKDLTTLHYNSWITVTDIPLEAYEYVVNGKPALDWVVERQCVKPDKDSGIVNDANDWAIETMNNPRYPLELFLRVITVSLETMKIVKALPPLDI
ncbi:DEAD/DEAH box helicase [Chromobacterium haemolyticum]|uniref:DEAD/DEAH box helicase n=1 Tax=Chromobacterium haemolyticum TaxID=394935 RepID=UPI0009DA21F0|nr:type ISP restriction/modification enzyme [Chromobacterium haemolyticum]OQS35921.1 damage-inducible protein [Chromobacterium haemolyticum]